MSICNDDCGYACYYTIQDIIVDGSANQKAILLGLTGSGIPANSLVAWQ